MKLKFKVLVKVASLMTHTYVGVEPSAALQQPADTSNAESMPTSLDSVG